MIRTCRFAAKVSPATHKRFDEFLSELRFLWNAARRECKTAHEAASQAAEARGLKKGSEAWRKFIAEAGGYLGRNELFRFLTLLREQHPAHKKWSVAAQRSALKRVAQAFAGIKSGRGCPRFKSENRMRSFDTDSFSLHRSEKCYSVAVKGVGKFKFKGELPDLPKDNYKTLRVVKTPRRVWVQVVCELPDIQLVDKRPAMGLDLGVENFYALSNGEREPRLQRDMKTIKRLRRSLSKAKGGLKGEKQSSNYKKKRRALSKACQAEKERHEGKLHQLSARLIKQHTATWHVEDLDVKAMTRKGKQAKKGLNRSINEQSWGKFVAMLSYKAESAGGRVIKVNPAYTSKTCHKCCGVNHDMGRRDPMRCIYCGHRDDRDVNAAKNMLYGDVVALAGGASRHARSRAVGAGRGASGRRRRAAGRSAHRTVA